MTSGLMTYTNKLTFSAYDPVLLFLVFVAGFFGFKFVLDNVLEGGDKSSNDIHGRHEYIK